MKLFEEFIQADYEMDRIVKQLIERINYWFKDGSFSLSSSPVDITKSSTPNASKRAIITNFADAEFYYQLIIKIYIEDLENCDVILKKYDPNKIDEPNGGEPISQIDLTNDKQVKINEVKEDFIIKKISELDDKKENPDENKIETPKEKEEKPAQGQQPPAQGGMPPGSMPPPAPGAQMGGMPPAQGMAPPAQMGGAPGMQTQM